MPQPEALLDTDILSAVMKGNPLAAARAGEYLAEHGSLALSIITRYEVLRGLKAKNAATQIRVFDQFCEASRIVPPTDAAVVKAAGLQVANWLRP